MSMLSIFNVSGSAASAQSQRLNVVASNLANADTVAGPNGQAYKARQVTFQTELMGQNAERPDAPPAFASARSAKTRRRAARSTTRSTRAPTPTATSPTATSTRSRRWST